MTGRGRSPRRAGVVAVVVVAPVLLGIGCGGGRDGVDMTIERTWAGSAERCLERIVSDGERMRLESCTTEPKAVFVLEPTRIVRVFGDEGRFEVLPDVDVARARDAVGAEGAPQGALLDMMVAGVMAKPQLEATDERRTIAGHACTMHRLRQGATIVSELCIAPWGAPVAEALMAPLARFPGFGDGDVPGVVLLTRALGVDGRELERSEVTSLTLGAVDDALFVVNGDETGGARRSWDAE